MNAASILFTYPKNSFAYKIDKPLRNPFLRFLFLPVSDFTENLAQLYEQHAEALQVLVSGYRKRNGELRKER